MSKGENEQNFFGPARRKNYCVLFGGNLLRVFYNLFTHNIYINLTSISTPAGKFKFVKASMISLDGLRISINLL